MKEVFRINSALIGRTEKSSYVFYDNERESVFRFIQDLKEKSAKFRSQGVEMSWEVNERIVPIGNINAQSYHLRDMKRIVVDVTIYYPPEKGISENIH